MAHPNAVKGKLGLALGGTLAIAAIIAVATLAPVSAGGASGADKLFHLAGFALLAIPVARARPTWAVWVALGAICYGGAIELIQPSFGRTAEWGDLGADAIGAAIGAALAFYLPPKNAGGAV